MQMVLALFGQKDGKPRTFQGQPPGLTVIPHRVLSGGRYEEVSQGQKFLAVILWINFQSIILGVNWASGIFGG